MFVMVRESDGMPRFKGSGTYSDFTVNYSFISCCMALSVNNRF